MTDRLDRRRLLALALAAAAAPAVPAHAVRQGPALGDIPRGAADAPLTVIEYSSFTCPHCARFHAETLPQVKANYIDTGKVRMLLREVYFDPYGLWASMIARCGGAGPFHAIADQIFAQQQVWTGAEDRAAALMKIGRVNGLASEEMRACLSDRQFAERLVERYKQTAGADGVNSTPSFMIRGELTAGNMPYEEFSALLDRHLAELG